jgi:hypothetical protein
MGQYRQLGERFAVLSYCDVDTDIPVLPYRNEGRFLWPIGQFSGWYWDTEVNSALEHGAKIQIREAYTYARSPVLRDWAQWVLQGLFNEEIPYSNVVRTHLKHCSRALIGRLALRVPSWEVFGDNPSGETGISHVTFLNEQRTTRMLHVGNKTLIETARTEGKDSLPQITGWIMAECRVRIWQAMHAAGLENIAHVDTDSVIVNRKGLERLQAHYGARFAATWAIKGTWRTLEVIGPRTYFRDRHRVVSGIPGKAVEVEPGKYAGERWTSLSGDLEAASGRVVTVRPATWELKRSDPRRRDSTGVGTMTEPYTVTSDSSLRSSPSSMPGTGL